MYQLSNLYEILHEPYFEKADFISDIRFGTVWAQMLKIGHSEPKSINFLILATFCLYNISKVLISNLTFSFCGSYQPNAGVTLTNSMSPFLQVIWKTFFRFFAKISKYYASIANFWWCLLQIWHWKKSKHILSLTILRF